MSRLKSIIIVLACLWSCVSLVLAQWGSSTLAPKGNDSSIVLDSQGRPRIAYQDTDSWDLKYAVWTGNAWSIETVESDGYVGSFTSITLDSAENPHISYFDSTARLIKYARWTGVTWIKSTVDSTSCDGASRIVLDADDKPYIVYVGRDENKLKFAEWTGTSWSTSTIDSIYYGIPGFSLACGSDGRLHLAYTSNGPGFWDKHMKYARRSGGTWDIMTLESTEASIYYAPSASIILDAQGNPQCAYTFYGEHHNVLKYARWTGGGWAISEAGGWIGYSNTLLLDAQGRPHVVCCDNLYYLKHLFWDGQAWLTERIDLGSSTVSDPCAAMAPDGTLHVPYTDSGVLKYARTTNRPTVSWTGTSASISPQAGTSATQFFFQVTYADPDGESPMPGYPRVVVASKGTDVLTLPMQYESGSYSSGVVYSSSTCFSTYWPAMTCRFEAYDMWGSSAVFISATGPEVRGSIRGYVRDAQSSALPGVKLLISGAVSKECFSGIDGSYEFTDLPAGGYYTVTPYYGTACFDPVRRVCLSLNSDRSDQDFRQVSGESFSWISAFWSTQTVDAGRYYYTSIACDTAGTPHIAYYDYNNDKLKYAKWTGTAWDIQTVDAGGWYSVSLKLDRDGRPRIAYSDYRNQDLKYAEWTGSSWSLQTIDTVGDTGWYASLALDTDGYPHIAYFNDTDDDLKYASRTGGAWSISVVDTVGSVGHWSSLSLDNAGDAHISYYDGTNRHLKYARRTGIIWSTGTVDASAQTGEYSSLALTSNGLPRISYYDAAGKDLKLAVWDGVAWSTATVDSDGDVGSWSSLALDTRDNCHIVYYDPSLGAIKYTGFSGHSWSMSTMEANTGWIGIPSVTIDPLGRPLVSYFNSARSLLRCASWRKNPAVSCLGVTEDTCLNMGNGYESTIFVYRVKYSHEDNAAPKQGYPRLHVLNNGTEFGGSPFIMTAENPLAAEYRDGSIYSCPLSLPVGSFAYYIEAYDESDLKAGGSAAIPRSGPLVSGLHVPQTGDMKVVGPARTRGIINPDNGERAHIYFQGDRLGPFTCRIFNSEGEILFEETRQNVNNGFFEWVPDDIASGIYLVHVEGPGINKNSKIAILR